VWHSIGYLYLLSKNIFFTQFYYDVFIWIVGSSPGRVNNVNIGICCFSTKHAALRSNNKDWLARNQDNVSEWGDISIRGLLFQCASTIQIQLSLLVQNKVDLIIISSKINLFSSWYSWKSAELALNNNHSLTHNIMLELFPLGVVSVVDFELRNLIENSYYYFLVANTSNLSDSY